MRDPGGVGWELNIHMPQLTLLGVLGDDDDDEDDDDDDDDDDGEGGRKVWAPRGTLDGGRRRCAAEIGAGLSRDDVGGGRRRRRRAG
jgi:hypothetical protein